MIFSRGKSDIVDCLQASADKLGEPSMNRNRYILLNGAAVGVSAVMHRRGVRLQLTDA